MQTDVSAQVAAKDNYIKHDGVDNRVGVRLVLPRGFRERTIISDCVDTELKCLRQTKSVLFAPLSKNMISLRTSGHVRRLRKLAVLAWQTASYTHWPGCLSATLTLPVFAGKSMVSLS